MAFADPLRFAMATIHRGVDYANSNELASLDGAGSTLRISLNPITWTFALLMPGRQI